MSDELTEAQICAIQDIESAESRIEGVIRDLRAVRRDLGGPPDSCGGERARRLSIAITNLETAALWVAHANGI